MQKTNKNWTTKMLVEGAVCIALALILRTVKLYKLPNGGSITPGKMIPLIIFALRYGPVKGFVVGAVYGVMSIILGGSVYHPVQAILDYPLAYGLLGLAGLYKDEFEKTNSIKTILLGSLVGILGRFVCHVLSGVIFFKEFTPAGMNSWVYSITYNASFLSVDFAVTVFVIFLLRKFLTRDLQKL